MSSPADPLASAPPPSSRTGAGRARAPLPPVVRAALLAVAVCLLAFTKDRPNSWSDGSRLGTIQGLVEHGTLALDDTDYLWQGDRVVLDGHSYSHQPPMLAIAGAVPYGVLHHVLGRAIDDPFTYRVLTWCLVGLPVWLGCLALARLLLASGCGPRWSAFLLLLAVFGTHLLPYSLVLNPHGTAAGLVLLGLAALHGKRPARAGVVLALACTVDLTAVFPAVAGALPAALLREGGGPRSALAGVARYGLGALPVLGLHFGVNFGLVGDLLPVGLHVEAFEYPYSPFLLMSLTGGEHQPGEQAVYAWRALFGYTGYVSHHPVTLLAVLAAGALAVRRRRPRLPASLLVAAGASVVGIGAYYLLQSRNFGGSAFGMRWFAVFSPLLALFPAAWIGARSEPWRPGAAWRTAIGVLSAWSVAAAALGAVEPWAKFHYFWHQKPEARITAPEKVPPDWPTHLRWEWERITSFRQRFDRQSYLDWFEFLLHRHGKDRALVVQGRTEAERRAWVREGLEQLRPVVRLLDSTHEPSGARILGHFWMARMHEILGERDAARREYRRTLDLRPGHVLSLRGLERLEAAPPPDRGE